MRDLLNGYEQYPPLQIEIEPTAGCTLGCKFCGLRGIRPKGTKPWKFLTIENAEKIARKIRMERWKSKIEFCGHGEPTLNKDLLEIIKIFRWELPFNDMSMMTNGVGFRNGNFDLKTFCKELEKLDFNDIVFDVYSKNGDWNVVEEIKDEYDITIMGDEKGGKSFSNKILKNNLRVLLYPLELPNHPAWRKLQNHCGAAAPLDYKREHTVCTKLFRELFIRWDGNVALCCDDFRGQYQIANILDDSLSVKEVWNHERFQAARIRLFNKDRTFLPCHGCDCPPNKAGFIPDITGGKDKKFMPKEISDEVIKVSEEAYHKDGLTTIVKRKWEE